MRLATVARPKLQEREEHIETAKCRTTSVWEAVAALVLGKERYGIRVKTRFAPRTESHAQERPP